MKTLEQFKEAGQELHDALIYPGMVGQANGGVPAHFSWDDQEREKIEVWPGARQPYPFESFNMSAKSLITGLSMGIASERQERLGDTFKEEVDVFANALLLVRRRGAADYSMIVATKVDDDINRGLGSRLVQGLYSPIIEASVRAVQTEGLARRTARDLEISYEFYAERASSLMTEVKV